MRLVTKGSKDKYIFTDVCNEARLFGRGQSKSERNLRLGGGRIHCWRDSLIRCLKDLIFYKQELK